MYRVFESLDELVELVETARGMPMSSSCVVPRSTTLDLLDDIRDALPDEMHDAQAVLDDRDGVLEEAQAQAAGAETRSRELLEGAENRSRELIEDAEARAAQLVQEAREQAARTVDSARAEADRRVRDGRAEYERQVAEGRAEYERLVASAHAEQERLVQETSVFQAATERARQVEGEATAAADRMRAEAEGYVEEKLSGFADTLQRTLRAVENGRASLRSGAGSGWRSRSAHGPGNGSAPAESTWQAPLR